MPAEPASPAFPRSESLARFFSTPRDATVPLSEVAELLGTTTAAVQAMLRDEGAQDIDGTIPWSEAAAYLFDAWPRARILDALGPAAAIPPEFQLTRVTWSIPIFLLRAIEHQAAAAWRNDPRVRGNAMPNHSYARGVDDYVADLLYDAIDPATVEAFREDRAFLRAFHYPAAEPEETR
jgi:hypothetical protein